MEQTKQTVDRQPDEMKAERTTGSTHRICTHRLRRHVRNITHDGRCHFAQTTNTRPVIYAHLPLLCCVHKIASHIAENKKRKTKNTHKPQSYRMHKMSYHWAHRGMHPIPVYIRFFFSLQCLFGSFACCSAIEIARVRCTQPEYHEEKRIRSRSGIV